MMKLMSKTGAFFALLASLLASGGAWAQETLLGQPVPGGLGLQAGATPIKEQIHDFHNLLLVIITLICLFVLALLVYVMRRFRASANPTPSKTSHNTMVEVIWTAVPVMILVIIAIPSMKLLYAQDVIPEADMTIKAIGKQWYWTYEYPDHGNFVFDAFMLQDDEAAEQGLPRLLATDRSVVIPVDTTVRILVTAGDVLHSFAVPSFGVKVDAVPGRLNETWVHVTQEGTYYGQCSELCGTAHAYMPIMVEVVSQEAFEAWITEQQAALLPEPGDKQVADALQAAR
ncbi:cytochrome c oxidase subunit II [Algihabitans albus]|uniref:cytochrome c oxidase subunit II n=1 Tax=Algihabitans albus TaxID=2164067 RepID=UPI001F2DB01A|nr:cytochrome c oxidase subunit II [Algihabitans albus]